eukprot:25852-Prymnesium_polylepis.1
MSSLGAATHSWDDRLSRMTRRPARAALAYTQLGKPWPPWTSFVARTAAANADVDFYFLGPRLLREAAGACANCAWLPLDMAGMSHRLARHLGVTGVELDLQRGARHAPAASGARANVVTGARYQRARKFRVSVCTPKPPLPPQAARCAT